jgi:hypothetical protein
MEAIITTQPGVLDHLYVLLFAVIYPLVGFFSYQRILSLIEQGHPPPRNKLYLETIIGHWAIMLLGVLLWLGLGRSWESMGFSFDPDWLFYLGTLLGGGVIILLVLHTVIKVWLKCPRSSLSVLLLPFYT